MHTVWDLGPRNDMWQGLCQLHDNQKNGKLFCGPRSTRTRDTNVCAFRGRNCHRAAFLKLFSSGDHFYYSECSTDHPTLVPLESKLFEILNYSVWYAVHVNFIFSVFFGLKDHKGRTRWQLVVRGPQFEKRCHRVLSQHDLDKCLLKNYKFLS
jgi:hypothetical protein